VTPPRSGFAHPIGRPVIREALEFFGPIAQYGLRSIELRQAGDGFAGAPVLATLRVPGTVILYEQPEPPWTIPGRLSARSEEQLRHAGAIVEVGPAAVVIDWPGSTLADFMLFDGLMHEIGHHLVQHHTGKRTARVMRTADHERRARRFATACRKAWDSRGRDR
jgi:hypothetical protein